MFDYSPADDNDRPFDAVDANSGQDDEEPYDLPADYVRIDIHGRRLGEGWRK